MRDWKKFKNVAVPTADYEHLRQTAQAENRSIVGQLTYMIRQLPVPVSDEDAASRGSGPGE